MRTEQGVLKVSIAVTMFVALFGVTFGLLSGSFSIVFDGVYSLLDASMSGLALVVASLIAANTSPATAVGKLHERFTMGFWHLEPMVLGLNGIMLIGAAIYAMINAIGSLMVGGRDLEFGLAIVYALVGLITCVAMAVAETRLNRTIRSDFVALDAKAWIMSAAISGALLLAFCLGYAIEGTRFGWLTPYVDPAVLIVLCLVIIPLPVATVRQALSEILLVTPASLKEHVDAIAGTFVAKYGFLAHKAYVAKVGRGRQIELYFIVPVDRPAMRLEQWDRIRDEIGEAIGGDSRDRWLTIAFTTDVEWAV